MYAALLDACVLVPVALGDTLLRLAEHRLFRPLWSEEILTEARRAVIRVRPDLDPARIDRRLAAMRAAFPDADITGYEHLVDALHLPDPDDRHVVAAAIVGGAQSLVTQNLQDFPADVVGEFRIEAVSPDRFLLDQFDLLPDAVLLSIRAQAAALRHPQLGLEYVLTSLGSAGVPQFATAVRTSLGI